MNKFRFSMKCAWNGLKTVFKEETNFKIEIVLGLLVILLGYALEISRFEMISIIILVILVLTAEIVNTAIEDICNKIEPNHDKAIGKIKDIMAGFVLITSIGSIIVALIIFIPKL